MHGFSIGSLIWIIILVIAVISSIRRNIQRVRSAQTVQMQRQQPAAASPPVAAPAVQISRRAVQIAPDVELPPVPPPPVPAPTASAPLAPPTTLPTAARVGTSPIRGMFGGSATLVRAIVAAEVLGPPIALQERTIWSPRHSEPSI